MDTQLSPYFTNPNPGPSPVAPGFVDASIAAGRSIQGGMQDLSQGLLEGFMKHKQNVQDSAAADTTFKMLAPQMAKAGVAMDPDVLAKFAGSSLSAKKGMIGAMSMQYASALKTASDQATIQEQQARANYYNNVGQERVQAQKDTEDQAGSLSRWAQSMDQQISDPKADPSLLKMFSPAQRVTLHAAAQAGATNPRQAAAMVGDLKKTIDMGGNPNNATGKIPKGTQVPQGVPVLTYPDGSMDIVPKDAAAVAAAGRGKVTPEDQFKAASTANVDRLKTARAALANVVLMDPKSNPGAKEAWTKELSDAVTEQKQLYAGAGGTGSADDGNTMNGPGTPAAAGAVPPEYVKFLQAHPESAASFDLKFGKGASNNYLP